MIREFPHKEFYPPEQQYHVFFENYITWLQPADLLPLRCKEPVWVMMANHTSPKQNGTLVIKTKLTISQVVGKYVHHIVYNIGECLIPGDNEAYKEQVRRAGEFYHDIIQALHDEGFIVREGFLAYSKTIEVVETEVPREWVMKQSPMTAKQ